MKALNYNYHDALIDKIKVTETTFTFYIDLYSIFYPSRPKIKLSFSLADNYNICKGWIDLLLQAFGNQENYLGTRIDSVKVEKTDPDSKILLCTIECDHIEILHFRSLGFKETEIKREIHIDEQLLSVCRDIIKENLSVEEWAEIESDDMFQTENYEGGFDRTEKEFVFSFYGNKEYWFQMTLEQVKEIADGRLNSVSGIQADYYND